MRALELTQYRRMTVREVETPKPARGELLLRVRAVGICGSDIHGYDGSTGRRVPPIVMGHEAAGEVVEVGDDCTIGLSVGDRVTFDSTLSCGNCYYCRRSQINLCVNRRVFGVSCDEYKQDGAFSEYVVVPERVVYPLPEQVSFEEGAMIEPLSIAVHSVNLIPRNIGDSVLVVGAGLIGLLTVQVLRNAGFGRIFVSDVVESRLQKASEIGADHVFNAKTTDISAAVSEATDGLGAACSIDAVGAAETAETAIRSVRRDGLVVLVGNVSPSISVPLQYIVNRQIALKGSCASSGEYPACLELVQRGEVDLQTIMSEKISLDDAPQWFERLYKGDPDTLKVIINP